MLVALVVAQVYQHNLNAPIHVPNNDLGDDELGDVINGQRFRNVTPSNQNQCQRN